MKTQRFQSSSWPLRVLLAALLLGMQSTGWAATLGETPEIVYTGTDAAALKTTADQMGNAAAIYEYLQNHTEYSPYHGSRSGSINTFLGERGSDVDIASTLIAMLRSQNIPARYAVGTIRLPTYKLNNWLEVGNVDVAYQILRSQGIQNVTLNTGTVDMEHVWVEALVPFDQYRGINTANPAVDCSQGVNASRCTWVPLDASFKQKTYNGLNLDPYNAVTFDYTAYYNAIKNNDATRRDKSPLSILEDQISGWLRENHPGNTLKDVEDAGRIDEIHEGLLPASLPFEVTGSVRHYDSVADHDAMVPATEPKKWGKRLSINFYMVAPLDGGGTLTVNLGAGNALLAQIDTKRLTVTTEFPPPGNIPNVVTRLGGTEIARPLSGSGTISGYTPNVGDPFWLDVSMDGAPGAASGDPDNTIIASYSGIIGGYYLVATGGESSNWSQVHRAADQLLAANSQYKIVFNSGETGCETDTGLNCTPYVDANGNGWDSSDLKLLDDKPALDALTGGLLYVAASQYYAKAREQIERSDHLMKVKTPIVGFLGVVSSVYEAEYIDDTAYSILPGGLLIDMKGLTVGGSYRTQEPTLVYSNRQFEFNGHIISSLEHEIWQELTGYDAVSTVRGFQMALANGAQLLNPKKNQTEETLPGLYPSFGFSTNVPSGFTYTPLTVFSTAPATWTHATNGSQFDTLRSTVDASSTSTQRLVSTYSYYSNAGLYGWTSCIDSVENQLLTLQSQGQGNADLGTQSVCNKSMSGTVNQYLSQLQTYYVNTVIPSYIGQTHFDFFDRNKGFSPGTMMYRAVPAAADAQDVLTLGAIRNDLYLRDVSQSWAEYLLPSKLTVGPNYRFSVDIHKVYETASGRLSSLAFEIANKSQ